MSFQVHPQLVADSIQLGQFELCELLLINDSQYPWFVLVPRRPDIEEIYQLSDTDQKLLWSESASLSSSLVDIFNGDKLNIAAIGNLVPQLHVHHVVRFKHDPCWPAPIWGKLPMVKYEVEQIEALKRKIVQKLPKLTPSA
ncbi:HIT domain-containing protein [Aliikangiella coralliicola]|uniref:HIT domain-containing protein n=1 Tax=Aliikangiella coralliicola TaxID=2592383 RepID=A0A545UE22_9GAMM|nr:HIT domain-containing protein [Aliikangiella coralliicola]TQV87698.1 HIT domain-containing protein [Aliikangiella coralliicola]